MESKHDLAKNFGATHCVKPEDVEGAKNEITRGEGFDYVLECVGHPATIRQCYDLTRRGGTAVLVGVMDSARLAGVYDVAIAAPRSGS